VLIASSLINIYLYTSAGQNLGRVIIWDGRVFFGGPKQGVRGGFRRPAAVWARFCTPFFRGRRGGCVSGRAYPGVAPHWPWGRAPRPRSLCGSRAHQNPSQGRGRGAPAISLRPTRPHPLPGSLGNSTTFLRQLSRHGPGGARRQRCHLGATKAKKGPGWGFPALHAFFAAAHDPPRTCPAHNTANQAPRKQKKPVPGLKGKRKQPASSSSAAKAPAKRAKKSGKDEKKAEPERKEDEDGSEDADDSDVPPYWKLKVSTKTLTPAYLT
jgi:hypothetical protein